MDFQVHGLQPDHVLNTQAQTKSHLVSPYMSCVQVMTSVRKLPVSMSHTEYVFAAWQQTMSPDSPGEVGS